MYFVVAITFLAIIMDILLLPCLREFMLKPFQRKWCGIFSRCASQGQVSFVEYVKSGGIFSRLDVTYEIVRIKKAALIGLLAGAGYVILGIYYQRRM